ncbi:unnamed protein product [Calypogeia fissa]
MLNTFVVGVVLLVVLRLRSASKSLPPVVQTDPFVGGELKFLKGPVLMAQEEYKKLGPVFTCKVLTKNITFLIGPEVCDHIFKAPESELSQKEETTLWITSCTEFFWQMGGRGRNRSKG